MSRADDFITFSLASCGLAVIDSELACLSRPDWWHTGLAAAADFSPRYFKPIDRPGVQRYSVLFEGRTNFVEVLARSDDRLALRLEWLTGLKVESIYAKDELNRKPVSAQAAAAPARRDSGGDRHADIETKEPGRRCSDCSHLGATGSCLARKVSGIERPTVGVVRRCVAFKPHFDAMDQRDGAALWPELAKKHEVRDAAA